MKEFKLDTEPKIASGFQIPENYFDDFSARLMQELPKKESKIIPIYARKKMWMYAVAAILVCGLSIPIYYTNFKNQSAEIDEATLEEYISYHSTVTTSDLTNLLDKEDIKKIKIDLKIDDKSIENELTDDTNLESYLVN